LCTLRLSGNTIAFMKKIFTNLTFWVLIAITAGILIGHFLPDFALKKVLENPIKTKFLRQEFKLGSTLSELLGDVFVDLVKLFINPIIFLTITLGIINMGDLKKVGRVGAKALVYFEIVTTFALIAGTLVAMIIQPGSGVDTKAVKTVDISKYTQSSKAFSWWQFFLENSTLQVLLIALLLGILLSNYEHREKIVSFLKILSKYVFKALHKIMLLAPIGAFGGMAYTISKFGIQTLLPLAKLMGTVYVTMAIFLFGASY
jgi:aerobic C4-dicarboxylate transport protein